MSAIYARSGIEIHDVPDEAAGITAHDMPSPWVDEMMTDLELGLEAVANNIRDKYASYGITVQIKENI